MSVNFTHGHLIRLFHVRHFQRLQEEAISGEGKIKRVHFNIGLTIFSER